MFNILQRIFGESAAANTRDRDSNKELSVALAAILIEIATVDGQFSQAEKELIVDILQKEFGLSREESKEIEDLANTEISGSIDMWHFTNLINENFSNEKKNTIMEYIWKIIYTDSKLNNHEDYLVHKLSRLLNLPHSKLIETKMRVKNQNNSN